MKWKPLTLYELTFSLEETCNKLRRKKGKETKIKNMLEGEMKLRRGLGWRGAGVTASQDARGRPSSEHGKDLTAGLREEPHGCGAGPSGQESRSRKGLGPGPPGRLGKRPGRVGGPEPFLAVAGARDGVRQRGTWSDLLVDLSSPVENGLEQKKGNERTAESRPTHEVTAARAGEVAAEKSLSGPPSGGQQDSRRKQ